MPKKTSYEFETSADLRTSVSGGIYGVRARVSVIGDDGEPVFGFYADASLDNRGPDRGWEADVSIGGIGSHSPDDARARAACYVEAARIVDGMLAIVAAYEAGERFESNHAAMQRWEIETHLAVREIPYRPTAQYQTLVNLAYAKDARERGFAFYAVVSEPERGPSAGGTLIWEDAFLAREEAERARESLAATLATDVADGLRVARIDSDGVVEPRPAGLGDLVAFDPTGRDGDGSDEILGVVVGSGNVLVVHVPDDDGIGVEYAVETYRVVKTAAEIVAEQATKAEAV